MKQSGTVYAPTLAVYESKRRGAPPALVQAVLEPEALAAIARPSSTATAASSRARTQRWKHLMGNTAALKAQGVTFTTGTDAGMTNTHHGYSSLHELELLVEGGLTPLEAIVAATGNSARALRAPDRGTIAEGKLADLVLVDGEPWRNIADIMQVRRVFLGGREIDREALRHKIAAAGVTPIPAVPGKEVLDDFESPDGRTSAGTLWVNSTDSGHDHTRMSFARVLRAPNDHALSVIAQMGEKDRPFARVHLPLTPGAVVPMDASGFSGFSFEVRGEGDYRVIVASRPQRSGLPPSSPFRAAAEWREVKVRWSDFAKPGWSAAALVDLAFELARTPGEKSWLEVDNVRLWK
jgi:hypothetical protein